MRQQLLESRAQQQERHNPLRGITMATVINLRDAGYIGDHSQLQWLYHRMLKSSATLSALRVRREAAIQRLEWDISCVDELPAGATEAQMEAQEAALRDAYERIDNLTDAFGFLSLAPFHGFAHMQKHRDKAGAVTHLEPLDQWNWIRDGYRGQWLWNPTAFSTTAQSLRNFPGAVIDPAEFLIVENEIPIMEIVLGLFVKDLMGSKDWSHFVDIYGIPSAFIIGPDKVAPGSALETQYQTAAQDTTEGGGGYLPFGSQVYFADAPRQNNPFKEYLDDIRVQMVLAGTGGKLTMLAESGSGTLAGSAHQSAFDDIAEAEAKRISECFQRGIDREVLSTLFPGQKQLAYFRLAGKEESDTKAQAEIIAILSQAGYSVDEKEVSEKTGFTVLKKQSETAQVMPGSEIEQRSPAPGAGKPQDKPEDETAGSTMDAIATKGGAK